MLPNSQATFSGGGKNRACAIERLTPNGAYALLVSRRLSMNESEEQMWLGQIPKSPPSRLRAKSISSILDKVLVDKGYAAQQSTQLLHEQWSIAVGESLAEQSRIGKIQRGVLQVFALNTIVMSELEYAKSKALQQLKTALPNFRLKGIRIQLVK